jgi:hypothetical protein
MKRSAVVLRGVAAALLSAVISILGFLLVGVFLPMWTMVSHYGTHDVEDAPAHGGAILLLTTPIAGVLSLCTFCILTAVIYRRLSSRNRR